MQRSSAEKRELSMQKIEKLKEQYSQVDEARSNMLAEHDLLRKDIETIEKEVRHSALTRWPSLTPGGSDVRIHQV